MAITVISVDILTKMTFFDILMGAHLKHIVAHILIAVAAYGVTNLIWLWTVTNYSYKHDYGFSVMNFCAIVTFYQNWLIWWRLK